MLSSKLISLIKTLSKKDLKSFENFLLSPYFNKSEELIRLLQWIQNEGNTEEGLEGITKEETWQFLFDNLPLQDYRLRSMCSELHKKLLNFLSCELLFADKVSDSVLLLPSINKPSLDKHFVGVVRQIRNQLKTDGFKNTNFHYTAFQVESQCHIHVQRTVINKRRFEHLTKADSHLDRFYVIQKLKHYIELLMWKRARPLNSEVHFFPDFLKYIEESEFIKEPAIEVYYHVVLLYLHPDIEIYYNTLLERLNTNSSYFTRSELHDLYLTAQNYCASRINKGNLKYYRELFKIYKILIEKELILSNYVIESGNYKNIITVGLMIDESEWVENFIQEYSNFLPKENQDNDQNYNLAKVYFHKQEYDKVITQLREVEYKNLVYALGGKLMLLKTYYELKELNALDSLIDSFRIYLHRNQLISRDVRQQYMNVLRFVRKLPMEKTYDKARIAKLRTQIEACKALAAKQWLLEKVAEWE